jgi:cytochrome c
MRFNLYPIGFAAALVSVPALPSSGQAGAESGTPPPAFAACTGCHSTAPGKTVFGPSLAGLAGRKAGSLPGYAYSTALRKSGLVWNAATLERWLISPQQTAPGTRMPFSGLQDPAARQAVIRYILRPPG